MVISREFNNIDDFEAAADFDFEAPIFEQCKFVKINFVGYDEVTFFHCDFYDCVISNMDAAFYRCSFYDCKFKSSNLWGSSNDFNGCKFTTCVCEHLFDSTLSTLYYSNGSKDVVSNKCEGFVGNKFCPMEGSFIAYKKCIDMLYQKYIVKLLISETAKRVCVDSFKCRASEAKVLEIQTIDGQKADVNTVYSFYDHDFEYRVGETVRVDDFDERSKKCSTGIHFFLDRNHAVNYRF